MSKVLNIVAGIVLWLWQVPQNILGLFLVGIYGRGEVWTRGRVRYHYVPAFGGGISLGRTVIVGNKREDTIDHEWGHTIQSRILGPLYLLVIGLPSLVWAACYDGPPRGYYEFYTERWADKLGKVNR